MIEPLLRDLSSPGAFPHKPRSVTVHQTHISLVFLAGNYAYKLKKPLKLPFVDYSTLSRRLYFCRREVELNQRLAPDVYLDVVPVVFDDRSGVHRIVDSADPSTKVIDWAVRMRRLDDADNLSARLRNDRLPGGLFPRLGRLLARFHQGADQGPEIAACAHLSQVKKNALDNFRQSRDQVGELVAPEVFNRLISATRRRLEELGPRIQARADRGVPRDTHGDLRLEHIYIDEAEAIRIVDCIEFRDAFRFADPVCDLAFLAMDLGFRGHDQEAEELVESYFEASADDEGRRLLDFYVAYRSAVRAKVQGMKACAAEVPRADRERSGHLARGHWLYALSRLEVPEDRPELILLGGLPAAGKSTLGRELIASGRADLLIETDAVRKELAGVDLHQRARDEFYTREFSRQTYQEARRRAAKELFQGRRVAVAATFVTDKRRREFIDTARQLGAPVRFIECIVAEPIARQRLDDREGDISDADISVYERLKEAWQPLSKTVADVHEIYDTSSRRS